jgi:hypothetical protein
MVTVRAVTLEEASWLYIIDLSIIDCFKYNPNDYRVDFESLWHE